MIENDFLPLQELIPVSLVWLQSLEHSQVVVNETDNLLPFLKAIISQLNFDTEETFWQLVVGKDDIPCLGFRF